MGKRLLATILTIFIISSAMLVPGVYAAETPEIKVSQAVANPGETVEVAISLENNPGIISMSLKVDYDSDLTLVKVTDTSLLPGKVHKATLSNPYTLTWANDTASENYTDNGNIVILTFKVSETAEINKKCAVNVSYNLENYDVYNFDIECVNFNIINGYVNVLQDVSAEPTIEVCNVDAKPGEIVNVDVSIINNPGVVSMTLRLSFSDKLTLIKVTDNGLFPGKVHKATLSNPYTLAWANDTANENYYSDGSLVTLSFEVADDVTNGQKLNVDISYDIDNYDVYDKDINCIAFSILNGEINVINQHTHSFVNQIKNNSTLKSAATCTTDAVYYYSCECEAISTTETFTDVGSKLEHTPSNWIVDDENLKDDFCLVYKKCIVCNEIIESRTFDLSDKIHVSGVTISEKRIVLGVSETYQLSAVVEPKNAEDKSLSWKSDNSSVVVNNSGLITAVKAGMAIISVYSPDGNCSDFCLVIVNAIAPKIGTKTVVNYDSMIVNGISVGLDNLDDYVSVVDESCHMEYVNKYNKIGTGSSLNVVRENEIINSFSTVIFGDVNGDGWYDGMDAMIVNCLAGGMLSKEDVSEVAYTAADCNHDGVIDQLDIEILEQAGVLLADVDQTKSEEELLETSAYVEYLSLIDQKVETETAEIIEETTDEPVNPVVNPFSSIISFIKDFIQIIKSAIAFIKADLPGLPFSFKK